MMRSPTKLVARRTLGAAIMMALSACALVQEFSDVTDYRNAADTFQRRWVGKTEQDVVQHYGQPTDTLTGSSGKRVLTFYRTPPDSQTGSPPAASAGGSQPSYGTAYCERRFELDKDSARVVRAVITGSSCKYDL
jgi:hypothetical protein